MQITYPPAINLSLLILNSIPLSLTLGNNTNEQILVRKCSNTPGNAPTAWKMITSSARTVIALYCSKSYICRFSSYECTTANSTWTAFKYQIIELMTKMIMKWEKNRLIVNDEVQAGINKIWRCNDDNPC